MADPTSAAPASGDDPGAAAAAATKLSADRARATKGLARNTAIFSAATGLSRIAGLIREVVARGYYGTQGPASAFSIAFLVPNLVRSLFADAALSAAFVPVFTDLLEKDKKPEAFRLASTLFFVMVLALTAITAAFILGAGIVMPLFLGDEFDSALVDLTVGLSRLLFPIVLLLGLNGLLVGILHAYGHFSVPAIAPLVWNLVIIGCLIGLHGLFEGDDQIYAYAIGVLAGTTVQLLMVVPVLRRIDFRLEKAFDLSDTKLRRVFVLMLPITLGLGIINFDQAINAFIGSFFSEEAPSTIEAAFRLYMLPQGMFSVALAAVLFPTLSRFASRRDFDALRGTMGAGIRQILLFLVPAAVFMAVLAEPIVRLVYERGAFDAGSTDGVSSALFWFSFSLPFAGVNLMLTRTFFALQRPWIPAGLAVGTLVINTVVTLALYRRFGIPGLVIGTPIASLVFTITQATMLKRLLGGDIQGAETLRAFARVVAGSAFLGLLAYGSYGGLDELLGASFPAQAVAVAGAAGVAFVGYAGVALLLRLEEAQRVERFVLRRLRARRAAAG